MRNLLRTIAPLLNELPNDLSIGGHTDNVPYAGGYRGYSNWELSNDRANASRRELVAGGLDPDQLLRVSGYADRVLLPDTEPDDPINRRIELIVLLPEIAEAIRNPVVMETDVSTVLSETAEDGGGIPDDAPPAENPEQVIDPEQALDIEQPDLEQEATSAE